MIKKMLFVKEVKMKKICMIFVIGVFLALMALPSSVDAQELSIRKVKFTLNMSGLLASVSQRYDFSHTFEWGEAEWTESVSNVGRAFGFDVGASIYPMPQLEIYASYSNYGGTAMGGYTLNIPDSDTPLRHTLANIENGFKASIFSFGLAFHPAVKGKIKPYFGAGLSSVNVKVDLVDGGSFDYLWQYSAWWDIVPPYYWYELNEEIELTKIGFTEESEIVWGFHAKAGVDFEVGRNISIFGEARFLSATATFDHPDITVKIRLIEEYYENWYGVEYEDTYTWTDEEKFAIDDEVEIKIGGIQGIIGIRFSF